MTALSDADWRITYFPASGEGMPTTEPVRAAYPTGSDDLPGWTLLKDHDHQIVKMVRSDGTRSIERVPVPDVPVPDDAGIEAACSDALNSFGMHLSRAHGGGYAVYDQTGLNTRPVLIFTRLSQVSDFTDARAKAACQP